MRCIGTLGISLIMASFTSHSADARHPFTLDDSIAITTITGSVRTRVPLNVLPGFDFAMEIAPNGKRVGWITRKADLSSDTNVYSLVVADVDDIVQFVNSPQRLQLPTQNLVVRFSTSLSTHAIHQARWAMNGDAILFIGAPDSRSADQQVYLVDLTTNGLRKVTNHKESIRSYEYSSEGEVIIYAAQANPDWSRRNREGYAMGFANDFTDQLASDPARKPALEYFALDLRTGINKPIRGPYPASRFPSSISIDPTGRWAVRLASISSFPKAWTAYDTVRAMVDERDATTLPITLARRFGSEEGEPYISGVSVGQYVLMDLDRGHERPLIEAPIGNGYHSAEWQSGSTSVTVSDAYLPLESQRDLHVGSAKVDLLSGRSSRAAAFRNGTRHEKAARLTLRPIQSVTKPLEIEAADPMNGRSRVITELNTRLSNLDAGHLETISWSDRYGRNWSGGLLLPNSYRATLQYPLIIQLNGYLESGAGFELPGLTSHPGRLFATTDMIVLQLSCKGSQPEPIRRAYEFNPEIGPQKSTMVCLEGAVDALHARGLIDRSKVGLVGFSHAGNDVHYAITFSSYDFAAAVIVDSVQSTLWSYLLTYSGYSLDMAGWDSPAPTSSRAALVGAQFYGDEGVRRWMQRSPTFHTDNIRTPVLFETHGTEYPCPCWETFALLKRKIRPVELVHYPLGEHDLQMPVERFRSRGMIIDWFKFWLKNEEDPDPRKADQFTRWHLLRRQHDAHMAELQGSRKRESTVYPP